MKPRGYLGSVASGRAPSASITLMPPRRLFSHEPALEPASGPARARPQTAPRSESEPPSFAPPAPSALEAYSTDRRLQSPFPTFGTRTPAATTPLPGTEQTMPTAAPTTQPAPPSALSPPTATDATVARVPAGEPLGRRRPPTAKRVRTADAGPQRLGESRDQQTGPEPATSPPPAGGEVRAPQIRMPRQDDRPRPPAAAPTPSPPHSSATTDAGVRGDHELELKAASAPATSRPPRPDASDRPPRVEATTPDPRPVRHRVQVSEHSTDQAPKPLSPAPEPIVAHRRPPGSVDEVTRSPDAREPRRTRVALTLEPPRRTPESQAPFGRAAVRTQPGPPQIHIGTIEVRVLSPPAPQPQLPDQVPAASAIQVGTPPARRSALDRSWLGLAQR